MDNLLHTNAVRRIARATPCFIKLYDAHRKSTVKKEFDYSVRWLILFHVEPNPTPEHLSKALIAALERAQLSQRELARRSGFSASTITQLLGGMRCSPEVLRSICQQLSSDQKIAYELLIAHLYDEALRAGFTSHSLALRHVDGVVLSELDLSAEMNANLGIIARFAATFPELSDLVDDLAGMILRFQGQVQDLERQIVAFPLAAAQAPGFPADHIAAQSRVKRSEAKRTSHAENA